MWAGRQKKEGREKLVSVTRGQNDIMLVMMDVTPL
jgi:hypothetical protein